MSYSDYEDSIIYEGRQGTSADPFVNIDESVYINPNNKAILSEVPSRLNKVAVTGEGISWSESNSKPKINQYKVDYVQGVVTFHADQKGLTLDFKYQGTGKKHLSASAIWTKTDGRQVTETLQEFVNTVENYDALQDEVVRNQDEVVRKQDEVVRKQDEVVRKQAEIERIQAELERELNESNRLVLFNELTTLQGELEGIQHELQGWLNNPEQFKGEQGIQGEPGNMDRKVYDKTHSGVVDNAEKVNGFEVQTNVPINAKFTDTVYIHPSTHPASIIVESSNRRFVTDAEKVNWDKNTTDITSHKAEGAKKHITESGGTGGGRYIKFDDGTMVCSRTHKTTSTSNLTNNEYHQVESMAYPASFIEAPIVIGSIGVITGASDLGSRYTVSVHTNSPTVWEYVRIRCVKPIEANNTIHVNLLAFGRWK